jgi:hypothetical protein
VSLQIVARISDFVGAPPFFAIAYSPEKFGCCSRGAQAARNANRAAT